MLPVGHVGCPILSKDCPQCGGKVGLLCQNGNGSSTAVTAATTMAVVPAMMLRSNKALVKNNTLLHQAPTTAAESHASWKHSALF